MTDARLHPDAGAVEEVPDGYAAEAAAERRARHRGLTWSTMPWPVEILVILLGYGIYEIVQGAAPHHDGPAYAHARSLIHLERVLHIDPELAINRWANGIDWLASLAGYWYDSLHYVVTPSVLIWLWWRHRDVFPRWRSALILASVASLAVFWLYALAPPRFALPGITDTLIVRHIYGTVPSSTSAPLINQFAAMPSLHVGWALWCAAAVVGTMRSRWRFLAWLYPCGTTFVVMATGNHYLLDAVGGLVMVGLGMFVTAPSPRLWLRSTRARAAADERVQSPPTRR